MGVILNQMSFNFISQKMRGSCSEEKAKDLRRVIRKEKPLVVTIQETTKENIDDILMNFLWGKTLKSQEEFGSKGQSGGIVVIWDTNRIAMTNNHMREFTFTIICRESGVDTTWVFTNVYGPISYGDKERLQEEVDDIK